MAGQPTKSHQVGIVPLLMGMMFVNALDRGSLALQLH